MSYSKSIKQTKSVLSSFSSRSSTNIKSLCLLVVFICFTTCTHGQHIHDRLIPALKHRSSYNNPERLLTSSLSLIDDTQINTYTSNDQSYPAIATLKNGGFVITWMSQGQDGDGWGVYAQMFDSNRAPSGGEFRVNSVTSSDQCAPDACGLQDGKFVITFQTKGQDGDDWGVYLRIYNADGTTFLDNVRVNDHTSADQSQQSISALQNGGFVVVWHSRFQDGSGFGIYGKIYNADGTVQVPEFPVNTITSGDQMYPFVMSLSDNSFVAAWEDYSTGNTNIRARMFSSSGTATAPDFLVNTYTNDNQNGVSIGAFPDKGFIIVWASSNQGGNPSGIYFQRYHADGSLYGTETQANTYTSNGQYLPSVTTLSSTSFLIAWESGSQDGSGRGVFAQRYNQDGTKRGTEFQVNTYTPNDQGWVYGRPLQGNSYLMAWHDGSQDHAGFGTFATIFMDCDPAQKMYGQSCLASCPVPYYPSPVNYRCLACDTTCNTCSSNSATACTSCSGTRYLQGTTCVTDCGTGNYADSTTQTCKTCDTTCATCSGSATTCTSCSGSRYLQGSSCLTSCPSGYLADSGTHACQACDSTCATCSGTITSCATCPSGRFISGSTCALCDNSCGTCSGAANSCTGCVNGKYLSATKCLACDSTCNTCSDNTAAGCLSCSGVRYLLGKSCVTDCGASKYANTNTHTCEVCDSSCATCSDSATTCKSCSGSRYLLGSACVTDCGAKYKANSDNNNCEAIPDPNHTSKQKTLVVALASVLGSAALVGLAVVAKFYISSRMRIKPVSAQRINVKSSSIVPAEHAKVSIPQLDNARSPAL